MLPLLCRIKFSSASHSVRARVALIGTKESVCDKIHHGKKGIGTLNIFQGAFTLPRQSFHGLFSGFGSLTR